jgi:hypothetical protein
MMLQSEAPCHYFAGEKERAKPPKTGVTKSWRPIHTHSIPFPCRAHAFPLPCRAAKGLEYVFPIWFTQCGRVWFTLATSRPCHAVSWPWEEAHGRGCQGRSMASANQTRPHCVNQMGKTNSKPLAARHGHGMLCVNRPFTPTFYGLSSSTVFFHIISYRARPSSPNLKT